jgi:hypothetical protein
MTNLFILVINVVTMHFIYVVRMRFTYVVTMRFNSHEHVRRWIVDQIIKLWEPFYVYGVI